MRRAIGLAALLAVLGPPALPAAADPTLPFERYTLSNGLTVILSEDHRLPQVAVDVWYHVGAANQTPGKSGFAHLFEHMMFSGAKHIGPAPFKILEGIGTSAGAMANGTTDFDRTNYFETVAASELPVALWLESDRMGFLLDTLDAKKLAVQRDVVSNERRQNYENRPYGTSFLRTCDLLYPAPHPYFDCVIGTIAEVQGASMEDLRDFFRTWYTPDNATLAIVGDFDPAEAKRLVERYFGPLPRGPGARRPALPQPRLEREVRERVVDAAATVPAVRVAWNGIAPFSPDEPAGDVLQLVLAGGKTSRLYRSLVFEKRLASKVLADNEALGLGGWFEVFAVARAGHAPEELLAAIDAEVERLRKEGPTAAEVERAKRQLLAGLYRGLENIGGFGGKADQLARYQTFTGDAGYLPRDIARYRAVTPESVRDFARKYLPPDRRLVLEIAPAPRSAAAGGGR